MTEQEIFSKVKSSYERGRVWLASVGVLPVVLLYLMAWSTMGHHSRLSLFSAVLVLVLGSVLIWRGERWRDSWHYGVLAGSVSVVTPFLVHVAQKLFPFLDLHVGGAVCVIACVIMGSIAGAFVGGKLAVGKLSWLGLTCGSVVSGLTALMGCHLLGYIGVVVTVGAVWAVGVPFKVFYSPATS